MATDIRRQARRLRDALEPLAGGMYVAPEAYAAYKSPRLWRSHHQIRRPHPPEPRSYFTSRGACMGTVSGEVVAAAFGCFNPKVVVPCVQAGWKSLPGRRP